jgi:hypothetical protein
LQRTRHKGIGPIELKQLAHAFNAAASVLPMGIAVSAVNKAALGTWMGAGSTGIETEGLDSMSAERFVAAVDGREGGKTSSFTKWGSAKEAFEFRAGRLRAMMDKVNEPE